MKKVISLILVVALFAGLAISASATAVVHEQCNPSLTEQASAIEIRGEVEHGLHRPGRGETACAQYTWATAAAAAAGNANDVMIINTETKANVRFKLGRTSCAEAITVDEMKAIIDADEEDDIKNLTVFYQRNVDASKAGTYDITLWPCNPERKSNQTLVVLFRPDGGEWGVLTTAKTKTAEGVSIAAGDIAVCMAW